MSDQICFREVHLVCLNKTLLFSQNIVGDVSCVVWDAALVLGKYIEKQANKNNKWLKNLKIIELGAGLGVAGIIAACYGGDVILTDLPEVVQRLRKTVQLNKHACLGKGKLSVYDLEWGNPANLKNIPFPVELILLSDCVYYEESLDPLIGTLKALCTERTEILISQEIRNTNKQLILWQTFLKKFQDVFFVKVIPPSDQDDIYVSPDIIILKARKKQQIETGTS